MVNRGENYIGDVKEAELRQLVRKGLLSATSDFRSLQEVDIIVICVPTPLTANKEPDISHINDVTEEITRYICSGQLITLESTTYPGTTQEVVLPRLEGSGLKVG